MFCDSPPLPAVAFVLSGNLIATVQQQSEAVAHSRRQRGCGVDHALDVVLKDEVTVLALVVCNRGGVAGVVARGGGNAATQPTSFGWDGC
jgi:hypothetical protein